MRLSLLRHIAFALLLASIAHTARAAENRLLVIQTNSANGYLYPCKCPSAPKGGLA